MVKRAAYLGSLSNLHIDLFDEIEPKPKQRHLFLYPEEIEQLKKMFLHQSGIVMKRLLENMVCDI